MTDQDEIMAKEIERGSSSRPDPNKLDHLERDYERLSAKMIELENRINRLERK